MNIGERIKKVRKNLNLTQQAFSNKISTTQNTIARYEAGTRTPPNSTLNLICRTFRVNEEWLRSGVGEMFLPQEDSNLLDDPNIDELDKEILRIYISLPKELRDSLKEITKRFAALYNEKNNPTATVEGVTRDSITNEELELIRQSRIQKNIKIDNNSGTINF